MPFKDLILDYDLFNLVDVCFTDSIHLGRSTFWHFSVFVIRFYAHSSGSIFFLTIWNSRTACGTPKVLMWPALFWKIIILKLYVKTKALHAFFPKICLL